MTGTLTVLGSTTEVIEWSTEDDASVRIATENFNRFRQGGYMAYKTDETGSETVHSFDPQNASQVMSRQIVGG